MPFRSLFVAKSNNPPVIGIGKSCFVSLAAMFKAFDAKYFKVDNWDNHGVVMDYDPFSNQYLVECTGISAFDAAWIDLSELDKANE